MIIIIIIIIILGTLAQEVIKELRPLHEQWVDGMSLKVVNFIVIKIVVFIIILML